MSISYLHSNKPENHILTGNFCVSDPLKLDENVYFCLSAFIKSSAASGLSHTESSEDLNASGKTSPIHAMTLSSCKKSCLLWLLFFQDYCLERKNAICITKYETCPLNWLSGTFLSIPTEKEPCGLSKMVISNLLGRILSGSLSF